MAYVDTLTGDPANAFAQLLANTERLRECFLGSVAPTDVTATEGQFWLDDSTDPHVLKVFIDTTGGGTPSWQAVSGLIGANVDYLLYQLVNARLENVAADMTPAPNNIGRVAFHTVKETIEAVLNSGQLGFIPMLRTDKYLPIMAPPMTWFPDTTNPPTVAEAAMTGGGSFRGYLFDATNERISRMFRVPEGWVGNADIVLRVTVLLAAAETANDDIEAEIDWNKVTPEPGTDVATKTSTNVQVAHDIGAVNTQYSMHVFDFTLDHDVAANVITAGDRLNVEFGLYALTQVTGGVIFVDAEMLFPPSHTMLES